MINYQLAKYRNHVGQISRDPEKFETNFQDLGSLVKEY
jgi:hypothetical protein